jgi:hypothetical protein
MLLLRFDLSRRMHIKSSSLVFIALSVALPLVHAQTSPDSLSGRWTGNWGPTPSHRHAVTLELKWDGKTLKGTINPGPNGFKLQNTSFIPDTGAIHMEVDAGSMGKRLHYFIDAKVEDGILIGKWHHTKLEGDFKLAKK